MWGKRRPWAAEKGAGCQRWDQKNGSGRKAGAGGYIGRDQGSLSSSPVCFGLWRPRAESWSVSWQEAAVTEPSDQGRPGPGWPPFVVLKGTDAMGSLHFPHLCPSQIEASDLLQDHGTGIRAEEVS